MENYVKKIDGNKIFFKDIINNTELVVAHNDDDHIFDTIFIDEKLDISFIEFIIKELKKTNDIGVIISLYDSLHLENLLYNYGLRISNFQYTINYEDYLKTNDYDISSNLDEESKIFYLKNINKLSKINHQYFNPDSKFIEFNETWFNNEDFIYRIYRKDGKIVGIVDYKVFADDPNYGKPMNEVFNYNNKLCIRCLFGKDKSILEDILKDLLNTYKKDIIISITYTENNLREAVKNMNGNFNYCQYTFIDILKN